MPRVGIEDRVVKVAAVPAGARFKGYSSYLVLDLVLQARVIRYRRERWLMPDGRMLVAPLPASVVGHSGPELRRFVLLQHHQGQVTVERLVSQLRAIGPQHLQAAGDAAAQCRAGRIPGREPG